MVNLDLTRVVLEQASGSTRCETLCKRTIGGCREHL
jgi:hypothetical protein